MGINWLNLTVDLLSNFCTDKLILNADKNADIWIFQKLGNPHTLGIARMAGVAQLVERWIVIPVVEGSNPFARPRFSHPITLPCAGVAQLDRASDFGSEG